MGLGKTAAVVIGSFPLGESDRAVTFYTRETGKIRGVARAARRVRSRFVGSLELFTRGELVYFDTGRSDLVRIDAFDSAEPFVRVRTDLERLGAGAWIVECVTRLTADRDRHAALYALLVRCLRALEAGAPPARVILLFAARGLDTLGHRPRLDRCVQCGRAFPFPRARLDAGGLVCEPCADASAPPISAVAIAALDRARTSAWDAALAAPVGRADLELRSVLESHMPRLIGGPTRTTVFLRGVRRLSSVSGERP